MLGDAGGVVGSADAFSVDPAAPAAADAAGADRTHAGVEDGVLAKCRWGGGKCRWGGWKCSGVLEVQMGWWEVQLGCLKVLVW